MTDAIVAGHLCLDIIPDLSAHAVGKFGEVFKPGRLINVGAASISTGGAVSNTGLAMHRLGIETRLLAKVGSDQLGQVIRQIVASQDPHLGDAISSSTKTSTSYTVVINLPGSDRCFLHNPGANDDFRAEDVRDEDVRDARLFHFGYPPLMASMFENNGVSLTGMFRRVKSLGLTTSLDMAFPDPNSPAGRVDWRSILKNTLPYVDIFLPSFDEILFMLGRSADSQISMQLLTEVSEELLAMGAKMIVLKLGEYGLYLHTASAVVLQNMGRARPPSSTWADCEIYQPCFQVDVVGTTGAGDSTIAGFLTAFLRDLPPDRALNAALGVGACCVESVDALSGIRPWDETLQRIDAGWARSSTRIS